MPKIDTPLRADLSFPSSSYANSNRILVERSKGLEGSNFEASTLDARMVIEKMVEKSIISFHVRIPAQGSN